MTSCLRAAAGERTGLAAFRTSGLTFNFSPGCSCSYLAPRCLLAPRRPFILLTAAFVPDAARQPLTREKGQKFVIPWSRVGGTRQRAAGGSAGDTTFVKVAANRELSAGRFSERRQEMFASRPPPGAISSESSRSR